MGPRSVGATEKKIIEEEKEKEMRRASERPFHATPQHKYHHHLPHPHQAQSSREREKGSIDARALRLDSFVAGESVPFAPPAMANAASGMAVDDECKLKFLELKAKRTYRFIIYKIDEKKKMVVVEKVGEPVLNYDDFAASLPANECRYAIFDYDFVTEENCQKSKIFFIAWSPDTSRVRSKMIYASSKDRFKRELDGIQVELQATDPTEVGLDVIRGRAN